MIDWLIVRGIKKTALYSRDHSVVESLEQVKQHNLAHLFSNDLKEIFNSLLLKQKPVFKDN